MALSAAQHVALLEAAIEDVVNGRASSYSINNRAVTKLDLNTLYEQLKFWTAKADREANGMFRVAKYGRPKL